jgi:hypothetical protein
MNFYPYSTNLPEWVRCSTGEQQVLPLSHWEFCDNQCPECHTLLKGVNNPLLLFSTIFILFGCNSEQTSTTIHWVAASFVKICVLMVPLHTMA